MNDLEEVKIVVPNGETDTCAKFTIKDANATFTMNEALLLDRQYILQFWIKSDSIGSVNAAGSDISSSSSWKEFIHKFTATGNQISISFKTPGVYYIYNTKLEIGDVSTDWTPAPEDIDQSIKDVGDTANKAENDSSNALGQTAEIRASLELLEDSIKTLVTDEKGESMMTQTSDGWTFNMGTFKSTLDKAVNDLTGVQGDVDRVTDLADKTSQLANDISKKTAYINMTTDESGDPCMELGKTDSEFKLRITNTSIDFTQGSQKIAYITNQQLYIQSSVVTDEMRIGYPDGFVWKKRSNGNMGLRWIGG